MTQATQQNERRESSRGKMTGGKVLGIFVVAFGIIMSVNLLMAYSAVSTFPGLEVRNSFVSSQGFNDRLAAQRSLGWDVHVGVNDGELRVVFTDPDGKPATITDFSATLGRATHTRDDLQPEFVHEAGIFTAPVSIAPGNWNLRLVATAPDGTEFRQRVSFRHRG